MARTRSGGSRPPAKEDPGRDRARGWGSTVAGAETEAKYRDKKETQSRFPISGVFHVSDFGVRDIVPRSGLPEPPIGEGVRVHPRDFDVQLDFGGRPNIGPMVSDIQRFLAGDPRWAENISSSNVLITDIWATSEARLLPETGKAFGAQLPGITSSRTDLVAAQSSPSSSWIDRFNANLFVDKEGYYTGIPIVDSALSKAGAWWSAREPLAWEEGISPEVSAEVAEVATVAVPATIAALTPVRKAGDVVLDLAKTKAKQEVLGTGGKSSTTVINNTARGPSASVASSGAGKAVSVSRFGGLTQSGQGVGRSPVPFRDSILTPSRGSSGRGPGVPPVVKSFETPDTIPPHLQQAESFTAQDIQDAVRLALEGAKVETSSIPALGAATPGILALLKNLVREVGGGTTVTPPGGSGDVVIADNEYGGSASQSECETMLIQSGLSIAEFLALRPECEPYL